MSRSLGSPCQIFVSPTFGKGLLKQWFCGIRRTLGIWQLRSRRRWPVGVIWQINLALMPVAWEAWILMEAKWFWDSRSFSARTILSSLGFENVSLQCTHAHHQHLLRH